MHLTRRAMYDLVWSKPMTKVAAEIGISDVGLKKLCDRHRVPTPPRGYWAKKEAGKPVKQIRFVDTADPQDELIVFQGTQSKIPNSVKELLANEHAARKARALPSAPVSTTSQVAPAELHKTIKATATVLRKAKPDDTGTIRAIGPGLCGIAVGAASVERVINFLNALAHTLDSRNLTLSPSEKAMSVIASGETVVFKISEQVRREKHSPTLEELAEEDRRKKRLGITWDSPYGRQYPDWDFIRTGQLCFEIENAYLDGFRRSWKDGKRRRLEELVEEIVVGIIAYGAGTKLQHEKHARWQRNYERKQRIQARAEARCEREVKRMKILDELVAVSVEANRLRTWLAESEQWTLSSDAGELGRFIEWARARLKYLDHSLNAEGIADILKERELFPSTDPLIDPPEDRNDE